jgi:hypothetical protein
VIEEEEKNKWAGENVMYEFMDCEHVLRWRREEGDRPEVGVKDTALFDHEDDVSTPSADWSA